MRTSGLLYVSRRIVSKALGGPDAAENLVSPRTSDVRSECAARRMLACDTRCRYRTCTSIVLNDPEGSPQKMDAFRSLREGDRKTRSRLIRFRLRDQRR